MSVVDCLHYLKKGKEDKRSGKGWYKLRWKPIKNGTWNFYILPKYNQKFFGCLIVFGEPHCCDGFRHKDFSIDLYLFKIGIYFWVSWKIVAMDHAIKESKRLEKTYGKKVK